ncbi:MAG: hypothetical protein KDA90_03410 [Planctomycetaceae bacterium]|nr:hypothetical protein [Planctomycetaceae bacterium]
MRRTIIAVAAVAATLVIGNMADAARARRVVAYPRTPVVTRTASGPGIFARLMELERRKNAWLFGR